jgi:hypothetical protein
VNLLFLFFEAQSWYVVQVIFKLISSCYSILSARITGMHHHAQLFKILTARNVTEHGWRSKQEKFRLLWTINSIHEFLKEKISNLRKFLFKKFQLIESKVQESWKYHDSAFSLLWIQLKKLKAGTQTDISMTVFIAACSQSQKVEATQASINRYTEKQNMVYTYTGLVFSI